MGTAIKRRDLLLGITAAAAGVGLGSSLTSRAAAQTAGRAGSGLSPYGPLRQTPDENGILLPHGFRAREIARSGVEVANTSYVWHTFPDGGATFSTRGGWIYASNSELLQNGGVGALVFDRRANIVDAYRILAGTALNCAGGSTPWGTWLSCEEFPSGRVWECDPTGRNEAVARPAMGSFQHEAVTVDQRGRRLYLTEDVPDGGFYRFTPRRWTDLSEGVLEIAAVSAAGFLGWHVVPNPNPDLGAGDVPTRHQVPGSTPFNGGEGITSRRGHVYMTTKGDGTVWDYEVRTHRMTVLYRAGDESNPTLDGVDNITAATSGDLIVAEDGDNMELVIITPSGAVAPLLRVLDQDSSELAGPAFAPTGQHLYFSSQRGAGLGITYEVTGPFRRRAVTPRSSLPRVAS